MPKGDKFKPGDLVFAKVKGYPAWPAKVTSVSSNKYKVFFYGTYEIATLKNEDIWFYTEERAEKFGSKYKKKKGYPEGMYQIQNTPEIAAIEEKVDGSRGMVLTVDLDEAGDQVSVGKPPSPAKPLKRKFDDEDEFFPPYKKLAMSPTVTLTKTKMPDLDEMSSTRSDESEQPSEGDSKKSAENSPVKESQEEKEEEKEKEVDKDEEKEEEKEGRKLWVRVKDTDDIIEINLDKDRPENFPSEEAKLEWERASAKKALKFKKRIENGEFVPGEIKKKLEQLAKLTPEEREQMDRERRLKKSQEKLRWLKIEQRLIELDVTVKTSLNLKKPSPDRCIQALDELRELGLAPLMLKKQPDIVTTIRRVRKYIGPHEFRDWDDDEMVRKIEKSINLIQSKAEAVFHKFKSCFLLQDVDDSTFLKKFNDEVEKLNNFYSSIDEGKILKMTRDPTQALSATNPYSDDEDEQ
eukprot:TRINITY_DN1395_c0_g1_i7.p1 TRINITY_DN1395_c0_g1~~TRINITY_DN1395_c0_g1_i7.p1  ORF type:complete len:465 (+),score=147.97 TRINITY_DN1395_c0_g1_i7:47-1441(+)